MLDAKIVGSVIREYREKKGISQEVASGLAGILRSHFSAIERGVRRPTIDTFFRIAYSLDVTPSELIKAIELRVETNN